MKLEYELIVSYRDKRSKLFAEGKLVKALSGIERQARLKLDRLEAALALMDLAVLPGNRFEALGGDRTGQYFERAMSYCKELARLIPENEFHYICGRPHFLVALGDVSLLSDLPINPTPTDAFRNNMLSLRTLYLYMLGLNMGPNMVLTEETKNHRWDAVKHLDNPAVLSAAPPSARFMAARSRSELADHTQAARRKLHITVLLSKSQ